MDEKTPTDSSPENVDEQNNENTSESLDFLRKLIEKRPGGVKRPQQEQMVSSLEEAILNQENAIIQAGTGTGKSLGELIPAVVSGKRVVVSTATKQLSEQITHIDLPDLAKSAKEILGKDVSYHLLKGRDNYFCKKKADHINKLAEMDEDDDQAGLDLGIEEPKEKKIKKQKSEEDKRANEVQNIIEWSEKTKTGDRTESPSETDEIWKQFSSTSSECVGAKRCPFGKECFAEYARNKARASQVAVVNHSISGLDLLGGGNLLGERDVFIFDECHELDVYLSSSWGEELTAKKINDINKEMKKMLGASDDIVEKYSDKLFQAGSDFNILMDLKEAEAIDQENMDSDLQELLRTLAETLISLENILAPKISKSSESKKVDLQSLSQQVVKLAETIAVILVPDKEVVKWISKESKNPSIKTAPLRIGPNLQEKLADREATMVATSATITVGGKFDIPSHNMGMDEIGAPNYKAIDVGTPFDYAKQAMIYIPRPDEFPAPIGKDRLEHRTAVEDQSLTLIKASGGRTLFLSSTSAEATHAGKFFRENLPKGSYKVLVQGEAPNAQLTDEFVKDETSILCATMGMWHGLNAPGRTCQLVIINKIPFTPVGEPLSTARQEYAKSMGRNGFMDVYVAEAATKLAQGSGRLIRTEDDKGVIAIFDTRLLTKAYGKSLVKSLPPSRLFYNLETVEKSLKNLSK